MKILALEFSSSQRSVAVLSAPASGHSPAAAHLGECSAEAIEAGSLPSAPLGLVEAALSQAGLEREQIECVAVGLGPGSYGGIRGAIALAQGWQLASGVKLLGLSSADGLATQAHAEGLTGRVGVIIDAQRNEFYLAEFELEPAGWRQMKPLRLASLTEVEACERAGTKLFGPDLQGRFPNARPVYPRAAVLARLARARTEFVAGEKLEPIYLRETAFVKAPPPRIWNADFGLRDAE